MIDGADDGRRARRRVMGWTRRSRVVFIEALASSGDVRRAAQAAGVTHTAAYALRRREPAFAAAWTEAMHAAYARIEDDLLAWTMGARFETSGDGEGAFDPAFALKMLVRHEAQGGGAPVRRKPASNAAPARGASGGAASLDAVERSLVRKLAALGKRLPVTP